MIIYHEGQFGPEITKTPGIIGSMILVFGSIDVLLKF
jgi:hypothetical protein